MRGRKKLSIFSLLLLLVGALFLSYKFVIPILIKQTLEDRLEKGFKRKVSLGRVDFNLSRGVELHHLLIYKRGKEKKAFLRVEELKIDYLIGDILDNLRERGKDFKQWQLALKVSSPEIIFRGLWLENLELPLRVDNSLLITEDLRADLCGGNLKGSFSLSLGSDKKGYRFQGTLSQIDLSKLRKDTSSPKKGEVKKKEIKGVLTASFNLKGTAGNLENLNGQGEVSLVEGRLGEFPLLGGLMAILRLPSLEKVTFQEGKANFTVSQGIVATEDLTLTSDQAKILAQGKIDLQGNFRPSLTCRISFSKGLLDKIPLIGDIVSFVIDEAGHLIAQVEVVGSLKEPQYRLIPLVKGIKDLFRIFKPSRKSQD